MEAGGSHTLSPSTVGHQLSLETAGRGPLAHTHSYAETISLQPYSGREKVEEMLAHLRHCYSVKLSQPQNHLVGTMAHPRAVFTMTEGDISVLPLGPSTVDLTQQDYRPFTRLYCMNGGYHLRILSGGTVVGGRQENDVYDILRVIAVSPGVVVIKGQETGRYLAMDKDGHVYGSTTLKDECYFQEKIEENNYNTYRSQKYLDNNWYLGLKKNGQPKHGPRTAVSQKAIYFLPRPVDNTAISRDKGHCT